MLTNGLMVSGGAFGQVPFGDTPKKTVVPKTTKTTVTNSVPAPIEVTAAEVRNLQKSVNLSNNFSGNDYKNYAVAYAVVTGKISFVDGTKNYERISWLEQVLSEHGCQMSNVAKNETKTGGMFNKVKTMSYSATIKGRDFVVESLVGYYGGSVSPKSAPPQTTQDPRFADVVAQELKNKDIELELLGYAYQVDKLIQEKQKLGAFDFSGKTRNTEALKALKESKIPGAKSRLSQNQSAIVSKILDLGDNSLSRKQYEVAISEYELSRQNSDRVNYNSAKAYQELKDYDTAIKKYGEMSSSRSEDAFNGIADCQHLKGNDREALNNLSKVLDGFHNTQAELVALEKIEKWGYLQKPAEYPEVSGKVSGVYVEKALLDYRQNQDLAVKDYKKAVDVRASGGSKAEASAAILSEYAATVSRNKTNLTNARQAADQQFLNERDQARTRQTQAQGNYERAVSAARSDYQYDLRRKRTELNDAQSELDRLMRNPPPSSGGSTTDPYGGKPSTGGSSTDPYAKKSGTSTDPYSSGTSKPSTDPYSSTKPKTSTDPYGGNSGGSNTDPYAGGSTSGNTDPYAGGYQDSLAAAKSRVERIDREYRYLYANESSYVEERSQTEARAMQDAKATYSRYDLSNQTAYVNNSSEVVRYNQALAQSQATYQTVGGLARVSGY